MAGRRGGGGGSRPNMSGQARQSLAARFGDAVRQGYRATLGAAVNMLGGRGRGGGTGKLADAIARETGEKRSTVMRRIQRALKNEDQGKAPSKRAKPVDKGTGVVDKEIRKNAARKVRSTMGVKIAMKVKVRVSSEPIASERTARAHLKGEKQQRFADAIENGRYEDAAGIVFGEYWGANADEVDIDDVGDIEF